MTNHRYRILLGASLALLVGAAGAQNAAPDNNSRMPAAKGAITTMPSQPSERPTDKMAADPNATSQGTAAPKSDATTPAPHRTHKSAPRQQEVASPEEKGYRDALRQCVQERDESQRDTCIDNAIGQHQPNG